MEKIQIKLANDNGNGSSKIIIGGCYVAENEERTEQINGRYSEQPNVIASNGLEVPKTETWNIDTVKDLKSSLIIGVQKDKLNFLTNTTSKVEEIYYVGQYALASGKKLRALNIDVENDKGENEMTEITTLAYILADAVKLRVESMEKTKNRAITAEDLKEIGKLDIEVELATSIPARVYTKEKAKQLADKFKKNEYNCSIYIPNNEKVNAVIRFKEVDVLPEGVTAAHFLCTANNKIFAQFNELYKTELTNDYFKDENNYIMHCSIGDGTTELPRTRGIKYDDLFLKGVKNGVGHAMKEAVTILAKTDGTQDILEPKMISSILRNKIDFDITHRFFDEVQNAVLAPLETQANEIYDAIIADLNIKAPDLLIIYGGGSILLRPILEAKLKPVLENKKIKLLYMPKEFAVKLEAYGLYSVVKAPNFKGL